MHLNAENLTHKNVIQLLYVLYADITTQSQVPLCLLPAALHPKYILVDKSFTLRLFVLTVVLAVSAASSACDGFASA